MASTYKIKADMAVLPIEEVTLADNSTNAYRVHSQIKKFLNGKMNFSLGSTPTNVVYATFGVENLSQLSSYIGTKTLKFLAVKATYNSSMSGGYLSVGPSYDSSCLIDLSEDQSFVVMKLSNVSSTKIWLNPFYQEGFNMEIIYGVA